MVTLNESALFIGHDDDERRRRFEKHGMLLMPNVFNPQELRTIRQCFTSHVESQDRSLDCDDQVPDHDILKKYPRFVQPHRHLDTAPGVLAKKHLVDTRLWTAVENLIGPAHGAQSMFYFKPPGARGQAMHQDNWFLQAHPETCIAAWIAVDDANEENGGLQVVPGTHKSEIICHGEADRSVSFSRDSVTLPPGFKAVQTTMSAGDVLFFHGSLVHGSLPNRTRDFRRALIYHYIPRASVEVARSYQPLIRSDGTECRIQESPMGGPCGNGWGLEEV